MENCESVDFGTGGAFETLGQYAFYKNTLKTINLENCRSLKVIGNDAFHECRKIPEITIPESVERIETNAFYYTNLETVRFEPNGNLNYIGEFCFYQNANLESINLEALTNSSIETGTYLFNYTPSLKELTIPSGFRINFTHMITGSGVERITFLENHNDPIGITSFALKCNLYELDLRPVKKLKQLNYFFYDKADNLHTVWIPASVTNINNSGYNVPELRNVYFEEGSEITGIKNSFRDCPMEEADLSILTKLKSIDASYYNDENLRRIALPASFTNFANGAIYNDPSLEDLYIDASNPSNDSRYFNPLTFTNCAPFTLHVGKDADVWPIELLQDASRSCGDILFEGPNNITFTYRGTEEEGANLPSMLCDLLGEYYADAQGVLYKLNSDGTATLTYVPPYVHQDKWDETPLTAYTVPATITDANGMVYNVSSVRPDAFLLAENLAALTVDGTAYTAKDEAAAALHTKYSVTAELEYTSLDGASGPQQDPDTPDPHYPEGGTSQKSAITEVNGDTTLIFSTSTDTTAPGKPGQYGLFTNESAEVVVSLSNQEAADSKIARVYFAFDSDDFFLSNTALDVPQVSVTDGKTFSYVLHRIEGSETYYVDIGPVDVGSTGSLTFRPQFSSPNTDGGKLKVWGEVIDYVTDPDTGELVLDEDGKPILPAPNTTIPETKSCHVIEWITKPDPFAVSKTADGAQRLIRRGSTVGGTAEYDLTGLSYTVELSREGDYLTVGKNYVDYIEFSDTLTLPEDFIWREGLIDAIRNGQYSVIGSQTKTLSVTLDGVEYTVASVKAYGIESLTPEITADGRLKLNWTVRNPSESIEYSMGKAVVVFGDEVLMLDPEQTYDEPETIQIDNRVESDVYYNYATADQYKTTEDGETVDPYKPYRTEDVASVTVTTSQGEIKLTKEISKDSSSYWGSPLTWTITASNPTAFSYESVGSVTDPIGQFSIISPGGMARMYGEDGAKELTVTITDATLCLGDGVATYPTETVTTVDGSTTAQTSIRNSTSNDYEAYHGLENTVGDVTSAPSNQDYTVVIHWNEAGTGLVLDYYKGTDTAIIGSVNIGAPTEANIDAALESLHYLVSVNTSYTVDWKFAGDRTTLNAHETRTFHIYANFKNTFEWITQDFAGAYTLNNGKYSSYSNIARAYAPDGTTPIAVTDSVAHGAQNRELVLDKTMSQNGVAFGDDFKMQDDTAIDNKVTLTHYGTGSYKLLPIVDHMSGSQIAMASLSDNPQLTNTGFETVEYDGEQYYLLTTPGTYRNVWMGGYCADSVTVTATDAGLDTLIKWYFKDTRASAWTITINYPSWPSYTRSGASGGSFEVLNEAWTGDHPTRRLYASMGGRGSALDFNKYIVDTRDENRLKEYTPIGAGETVLYRLRLICSGAQTVTSDQFYDALPDTFGAFAWTSANVSIVGYESTNGKVTLSCMSAGGDPVTAEVGVGAANRTEDVGGWTVSNIDPVKNKAAVGKYYILWDDDFEISYNGSDYLDIFVELSFPDADDDSDAWGEYCIAARGKAVYNTFYLEGFPASVSHDLKAPIKARLQKGVYDTGYFAAPPYDVHSSTRFPYVERNETLYYSNSGENTSQRVNYYVNLYNEGPGRLYLDTVQDVLPEGFTYDSLTTVHHGYPYPYSCNADTSEKSVDCGITEYLFNSASTTHTIYTVLPTHKVGRTYQGSVITPLSKVIADNVDYVIADVRVDTSGTTADGRQIIKATFSSDSDVCTLLYDEHVGKYYLEPKQCLRFGYSANPNGYEETKDVATNTVTMPVYDPLGTGLTVSETVATADNSLIKNDGGCDLNSTPLVSEQGFDTAGYAQNAQWLISDVSVIRDTVQPGIDKADTTVVRYNSDGTVLRESSSDGNLNYGDGVIWTLTSTNSSESALHDYIITDTMPAPFEFKGPFYINIYDQTKLKGIDSYGNVDQNEIPLISSGNNDITQVNSATTVISELRPLFELERGENGSCTLIVRNGGTAVRVPLTSGQTVSVGGAGSDVSGIDIFRYQNNTIQHGQLLAANDTSHTFDVTWTKTDAGETVQIHFISSLFDIPARGSMTLEYETREMGNTHVNRTYYNEAWLTPTQSFTNVAQGRDTTLDGRHSVFDAEPVNLVSGYSTVSYKTVAETADPTNAANSGDEKNYIDLPGSGSLFDYGLNVTAPGEEMETLVLIDNLPEVNDHATFADEVPRNSAFKVSLAETPNIRLYIQTDEETGYVPYTGTYAIDYSAKNAGFSRDDWEGRNPDGTWSAASDDDTRSIRLTMSDVPANAKIRLVYTAQIEGEPEPGTIAWNNFGYSYRVNVIGAPWLNATPPNVGIRVPSTPTLQKKLELDGVPVEAPEDSTFTFVVYKGTVLPGLAGKTQAEAVAALTAAGLSESDYRIYTRSIAQGASESEILSLKEVGFWEDGESYNVVELEVGEDYEFVSINQRPQTTFTFQYERTGNNFAITAVNSRSAWELLLTKLDARNDSITLEGAVFGLYSPYAGDRLMIEPESGEAGPSPYSGDDATIEYDGATYYLASKTVTGGNGQIKWTQLYQDEYVVVELEAPPAYRIMEEPILVQRGEDDIILLTVENDTDYELPESGGVGTIPLYALGALLMAGAIMCDCKLRRRRERRAE